MLIHERPSMNLKMQRTVFLFAKKKFNFQHLLKELEIMKYIYEYIIIVIE